MRVDGPKLSSVSEVRRSGVQRQSDAVKLGSAHAMTGIGAELKRGSAVLWRSRAAAEERLDGKFGGVVSLADVDPALCKPRDGINCALAGGVNLEVKVGAGGESQAAHSGDLLACVDLLAHGDV